MNPISISDSMVEQTTFVFMHLANGPVPAGRLRMVTDGRNNYASFAYGNRYRQRLDAVSVDPESLPLDGPSGEILTDEGFDLFNGIRDAAPDGWGRYLMRKAADGRELSEFDYLVASGEHRVGALAFGATVERPKPTVLGTAEVAHDRPVALAALARAASDIATADTTDPALRALLEAGSSLGGARPKAAVIENGVEWLAKFPAAQDSYDVPRAEHAAMSLARACGLDVPDVDLRLVEGRAVYLIRRFDRDGARRVPFASALTLLRAHEIAAGGYSYAEVAAQLRKHGSAPARDLRELFRRMVFNVLVGNSDDHLRNHGMLFDDKGWRLSPLYDVVPTPQLGTDRFLVLALGSAGKRATLANALSGHAAFGLEREEATRAIEEMRLRVASGWENSLKDSGLKDQDRVRIGRCFGASYDNDWAASLRTG